MVIINCKKCLIEVEVKNNRFKLCATCGKRNKKITEYVPPSRNRLEDIHFLFCELLLYMTISDVCNLYLTCTYNKNSIDNVSEIHNIRGTPTLVDIWFLIGKRDLTVTLPHPRNLIINIDTGIVCQLCHRLSCDEEICPMYNKKITKTECIETYFAKEDDLQVLSSTKKYHYLYRKYMTLYNLKYLLILLAEKHGGLTNYRIYQQSMQAKKDKRRENKIRRQMEMEESYRLWKQQLEETDNGYSGLEPEERSQILRDHLENNNLGIEYGIDICLRFIYGSIRNMSIDEIVAVVYVYKVLHRYDDRIYNNYRDFCTDQLKKKMYRNIHNPNYNWMSAAEDIEIWLDRLLS